MISNSIEHRNYIVFSIFAVCMGAVAGGIIWLLLKIMSLGIGLVWDYIPATIGLDNKIYTVVVCLAGGLLIGLCQKKYGDLPDTMEIVLEKLKKDGKYSYDNIPVLATVALLPLIFGGSIGPEAGLSGVIVGLCCWVGDNFKYSAKEVRELAKAGSAATLGIVFNSPFFGIANNLESYEESGRQDGADNNDNGGQSEISRKSKMYIYIITVAGGFGVMLLLNYFFGGGLGISRFSAGGLDVGKKEILAFIPLVLIGGISGIFYLLCNKISVRMAAPLKDKKVIRALIGGLLLAVLGIAFPWTMFSGEHEMKQMMESWQQLSLGVLLSAGIVKLLLINICFNFGWRGGNIFPIIFAGTSIGFAFAAFFGINEVFAVGMVVAAVCGYIMRKPVTVIAFLILCFPVNALIPMAGAAYIGSLIPEI